MTFIAARLRIAIFALFALSQTLPAGMSFAREADGGFSLVVCTGAGKTVVNWSDLTGEKSPSVPTHNRSHEGASCCACTSAGCSAGAVKPGETLVFVAPKPGPLLAAPLPALSVRKIFNGPSAPSRAPPRTA